jgi:hypothetical protein
MAAQLNAGTRVVSLKPRAHGSQPPILPSTSLRACARRGTVPREPAGSRGPHRVGLRAANDVETARVKELPRARGFAPTALQANRELTARGALYQMAHSVRGAC